MVCVANNTGTWSNSCGCVHQITSIATGSWVIQKESFVHQSEKCWNVHQDMLMRCRHTPPPSSLATPFLGLALSSPLVSAFFTLTNSMNSPLLFFKMKNAGTWGLECGRLRKGVAKEEGGGWMQTPHQHVPCRQRSGTCYCQTLNNTVRGWKCLL